MMHRLADHNMVTIISTVMVVGCFLFVVNNICYFYNIEIDA